MELELDETIMAYLDLIADAPVCARVAPFRSVAWSLDPLLRDVAMLSRRDRMPGRSSRFGAFLRDLFGISAPTALADPRLEAFRQFLILHRLDLPEAVDRAEDLLLDHAFDERELRAACAIVRPAKGE